MWLITQLIVYFLVPLLLLRLLILVPILFLQFFTNPTSLSFFGKCFLILVNLQLPREGLVTVATKTVASTSQNREVASRLQRANPSRHYCLTYNVTVLIRKFTKPAQVLLNGVSEPGPTRAWALASKAIVNYIHK